MVTTQDQRRSIRHRGAVATHEALKAEFARTGTDGFEALVEGKARQLALETCLRVSPDAAKRIFAPAFVDEVMAEAADWLTPPPVEREDA